MKRLFLLPIIAIFAASCGGAVAMRDHIKGLGCTKDAPCTVVYVPSSLPDTDRVMFFDANSSRSEPALLDMANARRLMTENGCDQTCGIWVDGKGVVGIESAKR